MRSTPSFFGEFNKQKTKSSSSRPPAELKIEKEANLREKRKQILQRLKQKTDQENIIEAGLPYQKCGQIDGISEKVIFSPRTAKRFQKASHRREITYPSDEITRPNDGSVPTIILQQTVRNCNAGGEEEFSKSEEKTTTRKELESVRQKYVPSFTEKPPVRKLQSPSPSLTERARTSPSFLDKRNSSRLQEQRNTARDGGYSNPQTPRTERKVYLERFNTQKPPLLSSSSLEVSDSDVESSPLRRSASFHSLKDRQATLNTGRAQFLNVDESRSNITSSLPSVRLHSSLTSLTPDSNEFSSTRNLKLQQDKLEQDFHRLEEDLDRAFSELRKYLKTG